MKIKRVEHIAIAVDSIRQSLELMRDTFGLDLEYEEQIGQTKLAMLPVGQTYIELLEGLGPESGVTDWIKEHDLRPGMAILPDVVLELHGLPLEFADRALDVINLKTNMKQTGALVVDPLRDA